MPHSKRLQNSILTHPKRRYPFFCFVVTICCSSKGEEPEQGRTIYKSSNNAHQPHNEWVCIKWDFYHFPEDKVRSLYCRRSLGRIGSTACLAGVTMKWFSHTHTHSDIFLSYTSFNAFYAIHSNTHGYATYISRCLFITKIQVNFTAFYRQHHSLGPRRGYEKFK